MTVKRKRMLYVYRGGGFRGSSDLLVLGAKSSGRGVYSHSTQRRVQDEPQSVRSEMSVAFHVILGEEPCVFVRY